ncbi:MAG: hypothetical protein AAF125_22495, partial [Chloroflexota bacterium]
MLVVGCTNAPSATPPPSPTLIPATLTPSVTPVTPTATTPPRTNPLDLIATPTPDPDVVAVPETVQGLVSFAEADLAAELEVPTADIILIVLESAVWRDIDYGCGEDRLPNVGELNIEGYRFVFEVNGESFAYHTDSSNNIRRCERADVAVGEVADVILADPVAEELVALARRRAASEAGSIPERVTLVSIEVYQWPDASLGCP